METKSCLDGIKEDQGNVVWDKYIRNRDKWKEIAMLTFGDLGEDKKGSIFILIMQHRHFHLNSTKTLSDCRVVL